MLHDIFVIYQPIYERIWNGMNMVYITESWETRILIILSDHQAPAV